MTNQITILDSTGATKALHTIEDSTSTHFNQSIPTDAAGNIATVVSNGQAVAGTMGALVVVQRDGLPIGANLIGSVSISPNGLNIPVSIAGTPTFNLGTVTGNVGVSIAGMTGNIGVSVVNPTFNLPVSVHPVTQSGTWNVGVNAGTNLIGAVSVRQIVSVVMDGTGQNFPVSIAPPTFNIPVSIAAITGNIGVSVINPTFNLPVSVHPVTQSGTWNVGLNAGTNLIGAVSVRQIVSVVFDGTNANVPVSIAGTPTFNLGTVTGNVGVSIAGMTGNIGVSVVNPTFNIPVSLAPPALNFPVSIAPAADKKVIGAVSIADSILGTIGIKAGSAQIGAVSVNQLVTVMPQSNFASAIPAGGFAVGGEVSSGTANFSSGVLAPFQLDANGRLKIAGTITGGSMTQTVGAAVTTEGYPMLGSDGTNARRIFTAANGSILVHVCNAQPAASGISMTQTVGAAVSTEGYPILGTDGTNARIIKTDTAGRLEVNTSLGGSSALIGSVSISPNGLNIPVSIAPAADKKVIGAVSIADTILGTIGIKAGAAQIGAVSVNQVVTVSPQTNFAAAIPAGGFAVGGEVSSANGTFSSGVLAPLQLDTSGRLKISGSITGGSMTQTVGAAVTTEGYPMLGSDGTNARRLLTTTGGALVVHVSNTAPGGASGGGSITVSVGGAVSTQATQVAGVDDSGNARTPLTNVSGVQVISTRTFTNQDIFTRPNDTTAYAAGTAAAPGAAGDLIANNTTAGSVKPLKFRVAKGPGEVSYIRGARLFRTGGGAAAGQHAITGALRLHLFNCAGDVAVGNGDNGPLLAAPVSSWLGYIDLTPVASAPGLRTGGNVSVQVYWGAPARTGEMIVALSANQVSIQGLLECKVAFTPIANEIFTVQLDGFLG